jgi:hypothetical protein
LQLDELLAIYDWDQTTSTARLEVVDDHTFTVNDGGSNYGAQSPTDAFSFRIDGDTLTIALAGQDDPWAQGVVEHVIQAFRWSTSSGV